jgi:hypothetical protein
MKKTLFALVIMLLSLLTFAHEGHNNAPGSLKSLHGGTVQGGKQLNLEVIISGKVVTIFPTSHEGKDIPAKDVKIEAIAKPKKGKSYPLTFTNAKEGLMTTVDLKGLNRIPVNVTVTFNGKKDQFIIQVEE